MYMKSLYVLLVFSTTLLSASAASVNKTEVDAAFAAARDFIKAADSYPQQPVKFVNASTIVYEGQEVYNIYVQDVSPGCQGCYFRALVDVPPDGSKPQVLIVFNPYSQGVHYAPFGQGVPRKLVDLQSMVLAMVSNTHSLTHDYKWHHQTAVGYQAVANTNDTVMDIFINATAFIICVGSHQQGSLMNQISLLNSYSGERINGTGYYLEINATNNNQTPSAIETKAFQPAGAEPYLSTIVQQPYSAVGLGKEVRVLYPSMDLAGGFNMLDNLKDAKNTDLQKVLVATTAEMNKMLGADTEVTYLGAASSGSTWDTPYKLFMNATFASGTSQYYAAQVWALHQPPNAGKINVTAITPVEVTVRDNASELKPEVEPLVPSNKNATIPEDNNTAPSPSVKPEEQTTPPPPPPLSAASTSYFRAAYFTVWLLAFGP